MVGDQSYHHRGYLKHIGLVQRGLGIHYCRPCFEGRLWEFGGGKGSGSRLLCGNAEQQQQQHWTASDWQKSHLN